MSMPKKKGTKVMRYSPHRTGTDAKGNVFAVHLRPIQHNIVSIHRLQFSFRLFAHDAIIAFCGSYYLLVPFFSV